MTQNWRTLDKDEIIQIGDFIDYSLEPEKNQPLWIPVDECVPSQVGKKTPDPLYPTNRAILRKI